MVLIHSLLLFILMSTTLHWLLRHCPYLRTPAFSTNNKRFNGSLCTVIVDIKVAIFKVTHKFMPLILTVANGFT